MTTATCKYPDIQVKLVGEDGNAFAILGRMQRALMRGNVSSVDIANFVDEATSSDYDHLLQTCMDWVTVE